MYESQHERTLGERAGVARPEGRPPGSIYSADGDPVAVKVVRPRVSDIAYTFLAECGLHPTPDAVDQMVEVFIPCLRIMCERGYDPDGANWREGGWRSQLVDIRKKFKRLWFHGWVKGVFVMDHPIDMINYLGYYVRLGMRGEPWGDWGTPEGGSHG